ncbi:MAG TPA: hypothetical protein VLA34_11710 [Candidatus Krumholzibacterium sp.]|nr:hypothetical protein [Candidatus Krumholzibacterium sp.]
MKRTGALKIVNPLLGICLINQVVTGLIHGKMSHETYEILHGGGGILLAVVALLHVTLNWNWIKANYFGKLSKDRIVAVLLCIVLATALNAGAAAAAGRIEAHLDIGAGKVSGELFEDTAFRMITGAGVFYTATRILQFGLHAGYTKWTPDKVESLPGASRIIEGSIKNIEIMGLARVVSRSENLGGIALFGEIGFGYSLLDSDAEVFSRPVVPDPGPYTLLYKIDSQNKPCVRVGFGVIYKINERLGIEAAGKYGHIFTDEESTHYYSIDGAVIISLF